MRELTHMLDERMKSVVVHLEDARWEPLLNDLEWLAPTYESEEKVALVSRVQRQKISLMRSTILSRKIPRWPRRSRQGGGASRGAWPSGNPNQLTAIALHRAGFGRATVGENRSRPVRTAGVNRDTGTPDPFRAGSCHSAEIPVAGQGHGFVLSPNIRPAVYGCWYVAVWFLLNHFSDYKVATMTVAALPVLGVFSFHYWLNASEVFDPCARNLNSFSTPSA